jgi:hypothetical protein
MTELDQVWSQMLGDAERHAAAAGQHAVADFLRLKATNDAIRSTGVRWLFDAFIEMAGEAVRTRSALTMERDEPHNFAHGSSNIVGSRLLIRHGVRCLTVEAGWTRTPGDGIMRGGALALARVTHFGIPRHTEELRLVHGDSLPLWITAAGAPAGTADLRRHFDLFLGG